MIRGIVGSVIGGVIGGAIWGAIAYFTGYEVAWIAIGVGVLCGAGMMAGIDSEDAGMMSGIIAVVIALASIAGGKFAAIHFTIGK